MIKISPFFVKFYRSNKTKKRNIVAFYQWINQAI